LWGQGQTDVFVGERKKMDVCAKGESKSKQVKASQSKSKQVKASEVRHVKWNGCCW
jgi:hypothetical protein